MELLAEGIRAAFAAADDALPQESVTVLRFLADVDGFGTPSLDEDNPETHSAFVQRREGVLQTAEGQELRYRAVVTFLRPFTLNVRDKIVLSDGTTGPILTPTGGLVDPSTGNPYSRTVYLGRGGA